MASSDVLIGLFSAAYDGNLALVKSVLKSNAISADISDPVKGSTALQWACCGGNLGMVEWLVKEGGAKVDHRNKEDRTALFFACEHCHKPVAAFLVRQKGADVNAKDGPCGQSPLHRACIAAQTRNKTGAGELIAWLLTTAGADPQATDRSGRKPGQADLSKEAPCLKPTARAAEISQTLENARTGVPPGGASAVAPASPTKTVPKLAAPSAAASPPRSKAVVAGKTGGGSPSKPASPKMGALSRAGNGVAAAIPSPSPAAVAAAVPAPLVAAPSSPSPRRAKAVAYPKAAPAEAPPSPTVPSSRPATTVAAARAAAAAKAAAASAASPSSPRVGSPQRQRAASPSRVAARAGTVAKVSSSASTSGSLSKSSASAGTRSMMASAVSAVEAPPVSSTAPVSSVNRANSPSKVDSPTVQTDTTPTKKDGGEAASPRSATGVSPWAAAKPRSGGVAPRSGGVAPRGGSALPATAGSANAGSAAGTTKPAVAAENSKPAPSPAGAATRPAAASSTAATAAGADAANPSGVSPAAAAPAARFQRQVSGSTAPVAGPNAATGNAAAVIGGSNRPKASDLAAAFENKARSGRGADAPTSRRGNSGLSAAGLAARAPALSLVSSGSTTSSPGGSTSGSSSVGRPARTLSSTPEKRSTPPTAASASRVTPTEILGRGSVMQRKQVYVAAAQKGSQGPSSPKNAPGPFLGKSKKNKEGSFMDKFVSMFSISPQSSPASSPTRSASRSPKVRQRSPGTGNGTSKSLEPPRMGFFSTSKSFKVPESTEKE